jgi:hypothetical protein
MIEKINKKTDNIIEELNTYERYIEGPNGLKATVQTMYTMIRLCSAQQLIYLLRTCPPSTTYHAAKRMDNAIANTILKITDCMQYLPAENSARMKNIIERLFLPIRLGGDGILHLEEIRLAAYIGSILHCKSAIADIYPECKNIINNDNRPSSYIEIFQTIETLKQRGIKTVNNINMNNIWEGMNMTKVQRMITIEFSKQRRLKLLQALPNISPENGYMVGTSYSMSATEMAIRRQGLVNDSRDAGRFLSANPCFGPNKMNNTAFNTSFHVRNLFAVMGSRKYCICGCEMDSLGEHALLCPCTTIRNKVRNSAHAALSRGLKVILSKYQKVGDYIISNG